jgi:hypothetical protein
MDVTGELVTDVAAGLGVEVTREPVVDVTVDVTDTPAVVVVAGPSVESVSSPPNPSRKDGGSCTGVRNTMTQTTTTRKAPEIPSNLRLCSMAPKRAVRKKPLSNKNRTMLTELFTRPAYQNEPLPDSRGPTPSGDATVPQGGPMRAPGAKVSAARMVPLQSDPG